MQTALPDYRAFVRQELLDRVGKRKGYSLRAFARQLDVSPGHLSLVLGGRKRLSETSARAWARKFQWDEEQTWLFINLVRLEGAKDQEHREALRTEIRERVRARPTIHPLCVDQFVTIASWYHYAIVELGNLAEFSLTPAAAARSLSIPEPEARAAIDRLLKLGLLERKGRRFIRSKSRYRIHDVPSEAIRRFHHEQLDRAKGALAEQPLSQREFHAATLALNPAKLPQAKALMRRFTEEMLDLLEEDPCTEVYHFAMQLFRVDRA